MKWNQAVERLTSMGEILLASVACNCNEKDAIRTVELLFTKEYDFRNAIVD